MSSSTTAMTPASNLEDLLTRKHSNKVLKDSGFVLKQYTMNEIKQKRVCDRCGSTPERDEKRAKGRELQRLKNEAKMIKKKDADKASSVKSLGQALEAVNINEPKPDNQRHPPDSNKDAPRKEVLLCRYHTGKYQNWKSAWSCCRGKFRDAPCSGSKQHKLDQSSLSDLTDRYQIHYTPEDSRPSGDYRSFVAVDCEMGTNIYNEPELIRVSLVDVANHEVLLDRLVLPIVDMQHYNTRYSGVTRSMMEDAQQAGRCLLGTVQARQEIWNFVGPSTLVIGHDVRNDLKALRWIHLVILDTLIMAKQLDPPQIPVHAQAAEPTPITTGLPATGADDAKSPEPAPSRSPQVKPKTSPMPVKGEESKPTKPSKGSGKYTLKTLSAKYLQREIQIGKRGHDSTEDALAAGDLAVRLAAEINLRESKTPPGAVPSSGTSLQDLVSVG